MTSDPSNSKKPSLPLAIVVGEFPSLSETFILREIEALRTAGFDLRLYALRDRRNSMVHEQARKWLPEVRYLSPAAGASRHRLPRGGAGGRRLAALLVRIGLRFPAPALRMARHLPEIAALARAVTGENIGYLHAHFATLPTEIVWAVSRCSGIPFGFSTHAHDLFTQSPAWLRYKTEQATLVTACTETHARFLRSLVPPHVQPRIERFYHGTNPPPADSPPRIPQPGRILAVGRLVPKKSFDTLIAACAILSQRGLDTSCEIVGDGPEKQRLSRQIRSLGLEQRVRLRDAVPQETMPEYYRRAMLMAVTTRIMPDGDRDGIPNVLLEAMGWGIPVIAGDTPSIREVVRHQVNGSLVKTGDPAGLANEMERLLTDSGLRRKLGAQAASTVRARFDARDHAAELVARLRRLLCNPEREADGTQNNSC